MIGSILTVCTGNICRSPLAEALLAREFPHIRVDSAGVAALVGEPADPRVVEVAEQANLDLSAHRAQQIDRPMAHEFDLILVMSEEHRAWLTQQMPTVTGKVFLLGHWDDGRDVPDPYAREMAAFEETFWQIRGHIGEWRQRLGDG